MDFLIQFRCLHFDVLKAGVVFITCKKKKKIDEIKRRISIFSLSPLKNKQKTKKTNSYYFIAIQNKYLTVFSKWCIWAEGPRAYLVALTIAPK